MQFSTRARACGRISREAGFGSRGAGGEEKIAGVSPEPRGRRRRRRETVADPVHFGSGACVPERAASPSRGYGTRWRWKLSDTHGDAVAAMMSCFGILVAELDRRGVIDAARIIEGIEVQAAHKWQNEEVAQAEILHMMAKHLISVAPPPSEGT